jgi:hypothetical protein
MTEPTPDPLVSTFVVRFLREWSAAGPRWRGRIEQIPSGKSVAFLHQEVMWEFMQGLGVMVDGRPPSGTADGCQVLWGPGS